MDPRARFFCAAALACLALVGSGCGRGGDAPRPDGPNILWVVWDTVRADRLGVYGHDRPTTPRLDEWARGARVYENATSTAGYTLPSHASMFTGLLPSEHCTHNGNQRLDDRFVTAAELLRDAGYRTFLYSANFHVSNHPARNLAQGFDTVQHPWDVERQQRALEIIREKVPPEDRSSELPGRLEAARRGQAPLQAWHLKAAGALAQEALLDWLAQGDGPWLAFLNYMEAHRPLVPPRDARMQVMSEAEVDESYRLDRSWLPMWEYTFGLRDYDAAELAILRATYDAALRELDDLFADLLASLEASGELDDTVVILTADHGEHLGEKHMLDHQYSLHDVLLRVPLIVHYPKRFAPGRDPRPVAGLDLFPTVLEIAGLEPPPARRSRALSLLTPAEQRVRFAEEPQPGEVGIAAVQAAHPEWDPAPYRRRLRALIGPHYKYVHASDGSHELYDRASDPGERVNLVEGEPDLATRMEGALGHSFAGVRGCEAPDAPLPPLSADERALLEGLGYLAPEEEPAP